MADTFYEVLGVDSDATIEEIEDAYRERLKETHPDLSDADDAGEATKEVIRARDVLTDEAERDRYDRVGHDAYVGNETEEAVDDEEVSAAARAAQRAGWASEDVDVTDRDARGTADARHTTDRRHRERAARERVDMDWGRADDEDPTPPGAQSATTATGGGGSATNGGANRRRRHVGSRSPSWANDDGYTVRQPQDTRGKVRDVLPTGPALMLLGLAFFLYPILLFSAVFPAFPLPVNVIVGLCTLFLVGYLQAYPEVGVIVFGSWGVLAPLVLAAGAVPWLSFIGVIVLAGTWIPFGLSLLTLRVLRF